MSMFVGMHLVGSKAILLIIALNMYACEGSRFSHMHFCEVMLLLEQLFLVICILQRINFMFMIFNLTMFMCSRKYLCRRK